VCKNDYLEALLADGLDKVSIISSFSKMPSSLQKGRGSKQLSSTELCWLNQETEI